MLWIRVLSKSNTTWSFLEDYKLLLSTGIRNNCYLKNSCSINIYCLSCCRLQHNLPFSINLIETKRDLRHWVTIFIGRATNLKIKYQKFKINLTIFITILCKKNASILSNFEWISFFESLSTFFVSGNWLSLMCVTLWFGFMKMLIYYDVAPWTLLLFFLFLILSKFLLTDV